MHVSSAIPVPNWPTLYDRRPRQLHHSSTVLKQLNYPRSPWAGAAQRRTTAARIAPAPSPLNSTSTSPARRTAGKLLARIAVGFVASGGGLGRHSSTPSGFAAPIRRGCSTPPLAPPNSPMPARRQLQVTQATTARSTASSAWSAPLSPGFPALTDPAHALAGPAGLRQGALLFTVYMSLALWAERS